MAKQNSNVKIAQVEIYDSNRNLMSAVISDKCKFAKHTVICDDMTEISHATFNLSLYYVDKLSPNIVTRIENEWKEDMPLSIWLDINGLKNVTQRAHTIIANTKIKAWDGNCYHFDDKTRRKRTRKVKKLTDGIDKKFHFKH